MFTREQMKNLTTVKEEPDGDNFDALMDQVPLRVIDNKPELDYYTNPTPSPSDHVSFIQAIINSSRIVLKSPKLLKIAEALFKQGFIFRHQQKAIEARATKYSRTEEKWQKEAQTSGQCDHTSCQH